MVYVHITTASEAFKGKNKYNQVVDLLLPKLIFKV